MPRNIEIKARVHDPEGLDAKARQLAGSDAQRINQHDTFFLAAHGRLKLREMDDQQAELIYYQREDATGPTQSSYQIVPTQHPEQLRNLLQQALRICGEVRKVRRLYWIGQTRVHIDHVQQLGDFVELEVVLKDHQSAADGQRIAAEIMQSLEIDPSDLVDVAYVDLLNIDS